MIEGKGEEARKIIENFKFNVMIAILTYAKTTYELRVIAHHLRSNKYN
jgi:hypothetical protein